MGKHKVQLFINTYLKTGNGLSYQRGYIAKKFKDRLLMVENIPERLANHLRKQTVCPMIKRGSFGREFTLEDSLRFT